jgi:hypothetical protein
MMLSLLDEHLFAGDGGGEGEDDAKADAPFDQGWHREGHRPASSQFCESEPSLSPDAVMAWLWHCSLRSQADRLPLGANRHRLLDRGARQGAAAVSRPAFPPVRNRARGDIGK